MKFREEKNGVLAKRGLCPLPKTGGFDENGENDEWTLYPRKQGLCSSGPWKQRKWRKWRVSRTQRPCLLKTLFLHSWKFALSKFYCRGASHEKQHFLTIFLSAPKIHPPQERKFYFYCCFAVSELWRSFRETREMSASVQGKASPEMNRKGVSRFPTMSALSRSWLSRLEALNPLCSLRMFLCNSEGILWPQKPREGRTSFGECQMPL